MEERLFRQADVAYPVMNGVMAVKKELSAKEKEVLHTAVKVGVYKALRDKGILTEMQVEILSRNLRTTSTKSAMMQ